MVGVNARLRGVLSVCLVLSMAAVASAQDPEVLPTYGVTPDTYIAAAVSVLGAWLAPALKAGLGLTAVYGGYRLVRRFARG